MTYTHCLAATTFQSQTQSQYQAMPTKVHKKYNLVLGVASNCLLIMREKIVIC